MLDGSGLCFDGKRLQIDTTPLETLSELGPSEMQIKNPKQGLFDIVEGVGEDLQGNLAAQLGVGGLPDWPMPPSPRGAVTL